MDLCIGIVARAEISGYDLMLMDYETYYYLRVEDDGNAVLKTTLSRKGDVDTGAFWYADATVWVAWAQRIIEGLNIS